jgi:hypothetical protein
MKGLWVLSGLIFGFFQAAPTEFPEPKSLPATQAKTRFELAVKKIDDEYVRSWRKLAEQLDKDLAQAQKQAETNRNSEEVVAIAAVRKQIELNRTIPTPKFQIISAQFGADRRWVDVTDKVRNLVRDGRLSIVGDKANLGDDPARGAHKCLVVAYTSNGKVGLSVRSTADAMNLP